MLFLQKGNNKNNSVVPFEKGIVEKCVVLFERKESTR